ncbi:MAG: GNAT family N-acetyltransferase, partial [Perlabentimonas sp.]
PLTEEEFYYMAQGLKKIAEKESLLIAEKDGQPIGYMISLPDFNMVFKKIRNGKLTIGGLYHLISWKKSVDKIRLMILGVLPEFRKKGVDGIFYLHLYDYIKKRNLKYAEICYVMEQNSSVLQLLNHLKAERVKTYQLMKLYIH